MTDSNCKDTCAFHAERDKVIADIDKQINESLGPAVAQHKAYWKFFFWGAGIVLSAMLALTVSIHNSAEHIGKSVTDLANFASNQEIRNQFITARQDGQKAKIFSLDKRVRELELNRHTKEN